MATHAPPARRGLPFEIRMAARYLTTRRREGVVTVVTLVCTCGVVVGVAALVVALALMTGLHGEVRSRLLACNAQVVVAPGWGRPGLAPDEVQHVAAIARATPGVIAWAPAGYEVGLLQSRGFPRGHFVKVKGIDPALEDGVTGLRGKTPAAAWARLAADGTAASSPAAGEEGDAPLTAEDLAPPEPPVMLLGVGLALDLGVTPGEIVHLLTSDVELSATGPTVRSRAFRVAGLLETGLGEYDGTWGIVNLARLRPGSVGQVDGVELALADPLDSAQVAARLSHQLAGDVVTDWTTYFSRLFAAFRWEKVIMVIALGLIGIVAGFNIFTILTMNVMARVVDIGVLTALGATTARVTRLFIWMGLGIGGAGTVGGIAVGWLVAWLLDRYHLVTLDPAVYLVSHVPFRVDPHDLVVVGAGMLLVSFAATIVPARAAARLDPLVSLRAG